MTLLDRVLILGCGYTGDAVARLARSRGMAVVATVRTRDVPAVATGIEVVAAPALTVAIVAPYVTAETHVVGLFPPDGATDARIAPALERAGALTYVSSTGVYGSLRGVIDDDTPVPPAASARLDAEAVWRKLGATILRCPAIYGLDRGIHQRILRGEHRIAGDGSSFTSRIHVDDLAALILASPKAPGETFVVGDHTPATQNEIASWVAEEYDVPFPPSVPIESVHETLRADRKIDGSRALRLLGITLTFPDYRSGMRGAPQPPRSTSPSRSSSS